MEDSLFKNSSTFQKQQKIVKKERLYDFTEKAEDELITHCFIISKKCSRMEILREQNF